jgi:YrbI family 3-deoxy-D-manno-octulosonate 8-phosphate phosphatase
LYAKCKKIKLVLTDVDGVLTDGGMYYTDKGDIMKKFFTRDGMGVTLLKKHNIPTIIVTKENTKMVKQWAKRMKVAALYDGITQKESILDSICKDYKITVKEVAYVGDDVNDIGLLKKVGFAVVPNDGTNEARVVSDYICKNKGGNGAFREVVDLILQARSHNNA